MRPPQAYCRSIPNAITATRFLFALALLFVSPGSVPFWLCYGGGAASEMCWTAGWPDGSTGRATPVPNGTAWRT